MTLAELAANIGMMVGVAVAPQSYNNPTYWDLVTKEFNSLTPMNEMKFTLIHPTPETYNFSPPDETCDFALENEMGARGHTLVWHASAGWQATLPVAERRTIMRDHIRNVVRRYRGDVDSWDVVNEAFEGDGSVRRSFWSETTGYTTRYMDTAFRIAKAVAPRTDMFYNDYGIEPINAKSDAVYNYCLQALSEGVPINGIGFQMHILQKYGLDIDSFKANARRFAALGLKLEITEFDVRMEEPVTDAKLQIQKKLYYDIVKAAIEVGIKRITVWGLTDIPDWIPNPRFLGAPLLFDKDYKKKPAYRGFRQALVEADQ